MIPKIQSQSIREGQFEFKGRPLALVLDAAAFERSAVERSIVERFVGELRGLGFSATFADAASSFGARIDLAIVEGATPKEGYLLQVERDGIRLVASTPAGIFYGTRTLLARAVVEGRIAVGRYEDAPRFRWRGAHLDVARHFYPVAYVKRFIDLLALHKMNVFHWHLTEDQGWRIEIDAFPKLREVAAFRKHGDQLYGGYYTKDEVRDIVAYAQERFVEVVPEIEMPGHALAALAAYPELSCTGGPFEVETRWGIFDDVFCAGSEETFRFLERVVDEVIELFPSVYFHIGGDECPKTRWRECARCQARIRELGLANEAELQSWFVSRMSRSLAERGRRLVGWDEILEGGLAEGATVMSWRGTEGGIRAAKLGHDVVMSPTSHCYLDYKQSSESEEPGAWFAPALSLEKVYGYEPIPRELSEREAEHVLGVQGNVWTERMPTIQQVEYMTFPRLCALAEVAWSAPERDYEEFLARLVLHERLLDHYEVGYRGSKLARPVQPTDEEKAQYARAMAERAAQGASLAAYS